MKHEEISSKLLDYLDGVLTPGELAECEAHLESCAECRQVLAEYQVLGSLERQIAGERHLPPPALRVKIMESLDEGAGGRIGFSFEYFRKWLIPVSSLAVIGLVVLVSTSQKPWYEEDREAKIIAQTHLYSAPEASPAAPTPAPTSVTAPEKVMEMTFPQQDERKKLENVPPGYQAITIPVDKKSAEVANLAQNSRVDVLLTQKDGRSKEKQVTTIVSSAKVLTSSERLSQTSGNAVGTADPLADSQEFAEELGSLNRTHNARATEQNCLEPLFETRGGQFEGDPGTASAVSSLNAKLQSDLEGLMSGRSLAEVRTFATEMRALGLEITPSLESCLIEQLAPVRSDYIRKVIR